MEQHGKILAVAHQLKAGRPRNRLLARLVENETLLLDVHNQLTEDVKADRRITPAAEWLLDNFYLIEEHIRTARRHLPKSYSRGLPHLLNGPSAGLPRVYDIALEIISHGDGRVYLENLCSFVASYQSVIPLKLGELWAIPIMLRLSLIENIRRAAARIATDRIDRNRADYWADQIIETAAKDPKAVILAIADMARSNPQLVSAFVAEITHRLQGQGPALALPLTWIEQQMSESGITIEQLVRSENRQQASDRVSMSNSIESLRSMDAIDWREFVETMSVVEQTLREDPSTVYGKMDFATRDHYRHVVEMTALRSSYSEIEVARMVTQLSREGMARKGSDNRVAHVGYYLIDEGLVQLERMTDIHLSFADIARKIGRRFPLALYTGAILLLTAIFAGLFTTKAYSDGLHGWLLYPFGLLLFLCSSYLAVAMVNWITNLLVSPRQLPRMDYSQGIPPELRTLVVIPTMLSSAKNIENLVEALEVRFLGNRDDHIHFGLLTDFRDAFEEILPEDGPLLCHARQRIEELNKKYPNSAGNIFFLLHRPRRWNPHDRIYMGYERKRGKLEDLNGFLRGRSKDRFKLVVGDTTILSDVKYVIALDTDTQLPRDSAFQFVGTMAHPLNRARFDEGRQRVIGGYGILQPRVATNLPGTNRSRYARMYADEFGIDPYTRAVSDVYQDVFGEGSFTGKGIYEVDAFEQTLSGRFPDNRILSHDLLEGCYVRSGSLSDVPLYEEYPSRYNADVARRHRWIRGDWQIARWLMPRLPGHDLRKERNPLSALSKWKIFDNLRRSLIPAALTLLLLMGWTVLPSVWFWILTVIGIIFVPLLIASVLKVLQKPRDVAPGYHLQASARAAIRCLSQAAFMLICLPYEALFSLDAIVRVAWRMLITHKQLLQWNPSHDSNRKIREDLVGSYRTMWISPLVVVASVIVAALFRPGALAISWPILCLWFASPVITWWMSKPLIPHRVELTKDQTQFLRKISRKTWAFFETFVGPEDHWLPPDNYQEYPAEAIAHRTSPTNMGLALLANLSAYDFGYLSAGQLIERTSKTFGTMKTMERYRGHFYNWYDTYSLKPLPPLYISSVDSGNLAGHLLTLRHGLVGLTNHKILETQFFEGLSDTLQIIREAVAAASEAHNLAHLAKLQHDLESVVSSKPASLVASQQCLGQLVTSATQAIAEVEILSGDSRRQLSWWMLAFARQCQDALDELTYLAPWIGILTSTNSHIEFPDLDEIPTLGELATAEVKLLPAIQNRLKSTDMSTERARLGNLQQLIMVGSQHAMTRIAAIKELNFQCDAFAAAGI